MFDERRKHTRVHQEEQIAIVVTARSKETEFPEQTIYCSTADASTTGLQIRMQRDLPVGCLLNLQVHMDALPRVIRLVGEVRWSREDAVTGARLVGLELSQTPDKELEAWCELICERIRFFEL